MEKIFNFKQKKTILEAIIFYIISFVIAVVCAGLAGAIMGATGNLEYAALAGAITSSGVVVYFSYMIYKESSPDNIKIILLISAIFISLLFGAIYGLFIVAITTCLANENTKTLNKSINKPKRPINILKDENTFEKDSKLKSNIDDILNESSIPKTFINEDSNNSTIENEIKKFENELLSLSNPNDDLYDYKYWYSFVQGRAKSMTLYKNQSDNDFIEESAWGHADEYSKRLLDSSDTEKSNFVKPRIICYGKIYDLLKDLKNKLKDNYQAQDLNEQFRLEVIHAKASLFGAIKFAQKSNVSNHQIKLWYPNFIDDVKDSEAPFLKSIRKMFVGEDSNSKLFSIYDLTENQKNEIPFWFKKGLFIFGFFKQGKNFKVGSKSVKLNRLERSMFFHHQQFEMLLNQLPEFNKDGSYEFGNYEFFIETNEIKQLIKQYFEDNNKNALELLNTKSK